MIMTNPRYLRVGKACAAFVRYSGWKCALIGFLFPGFSKVMGELMDSMQPLIEDGEFGTDEELGL